VFLKMLLLLVLLLATDPASSADSICVGLANDTQCATMHGYDMQPRPAVNRSNSVTFDIKEEYYNDNTDLVEETKWEKKVVLYENEMKEINLTSDSLNINPRRMYVWYNKTGDLYVAVEQILYMSSNTSNKTSTSCPCQFYEMTSYLNNDNTQRVVYAKNMTKADSGNFYYSDIVTVTRAARDIPLSSSPDQECFDWQVSQGYLPGAETTLNSGNVSLKTVTVRLTQMVDSERGSSDNVTHQTINTTTVTLVEGKREYVQLTYTNHTSDGFQYIGPRNITLLVRGDYSGDYPLYWLYAGMAILSEEVSEGDNSSVITCDNRHNVDRDDPYSFMIVPSTGSWSDAKKLDYYVFESHVHPDMAVWRDVEYLTISVSSAGTQSAARSRAGSCSTVPGILRDRVKLL